MLDLLFDLSWRSGQEQATQGSRVQIVIFFLDSIFFVILQKLLEMRDLLKRGCTVIKLNGYVTKTYIAYLSTHVRNV